MQRMILEALEPSKQLHAGGNLNYRGGYFNPRYHDPFTIYQGRKIELPKNRNWYDVRAVKALVMQAMGEASRVYQGTYKSLRSLDAAFSRALRSLLKRGDLERASNAGDRELRFVRAVKAQGELTIPELIKAVAWSENRVALLSAAPA
jgi:hypothetical protein